MSRQHPTLSHPVAHTPPRVGVAALILREGKILLGKRRNAHGAGAWSTPGGHLEFGESVEGCTARELLEETGMRALSIRAGPYTNDVIEDTKHYITLFMFVDIGTQEPELLEPEKCEGWLWKDIRELPQPLFPSIQTLVRQVGIEGLERLARERIPTTP